MRLSALVVLVAIGFAAPALAKPTQPEFVDLPERLFGLFRESPDWRECFATPQGSGIPCVPREEVLADQLAFYATANLDFRSSYYVPPLAERQAVAQAIRESG